MKTRDEKKNNRISKKISTPTNIPYTNTLRRMHKHDKCKPIVLYIAIGGRALA